MHIDVENLYISVGLFFCEQGGHAMSEEFEEEGEESEEEGEEEEW
jgi:hypothetical protein